MMLAMLVPDVLRPKRTDIREMAIRDTSKEMTAKIFKKQGKARKTKKNVKVSFFSAVDARTEKGRR